MSAYDLIGFEETKLYLNVSKDDQDALIKTLISGVSSMIETYCDRQFVARDYTEQYDGGGETYLLLNQWPIISITGIWDDCDRLFPSTTLVDSTDYTFYADEGKIQLVSTTLSTLSNYNFDDGVRNVKIIYRAGYTTVPLDLQMIAAEMISKKYKNFMDRRFGMTSISSGGEGVSLMLSDILPDHRSILDRKYKRRGIQ